MNKNLVMTIAVGDAYVAMSKLTHPSIKKYAEKIGADFFSVDTSLESTPHWSKFTNIHRLLNSYHRLLYCDTDILIRDDCPNIFDIVPVGEIGLFNELPFVTEPRGQSLMMACKDYDIVLKDWNGNYYNTGVMVISRQHKQLFKKPDK